LINGAALLVDARRLLRDPRDTSGGFDKNAPETSNPIT